MRSSEVTPVQDVIPEHCVKFMLCWYRGSGYYLPQLCIPGGCNIPLFNVVAVGVNSVMIIIPADNDLCCLPERTDHHVITPGEPVPLRPVIKEGEVSHAVITTSFADICKKQNYYTDIKGEYEVKFDHD